MQPIPQPSSNEKSDEISFKEFVLQLTSLFRFIFQKWRIIIIATALGAVAGLLLAISKKTEYVGTLTFVLEDSKISGFGGYAGLASQFGIDLGGGSTSGLFTGDNILEFLKSRLMVEKTLLSSIDENGKNMSLADYYIDMMALRNKWGEKKELANIKFPLSEKREGFTLVQDSILKVFYASIIKNNLVVAKPDKKLSFIAVTCKSRSELFSKVFVENLVKHATGFYVATKTQRSKSTVDKLQAKADSIEYLLNKKAYSAAASQDLNLNPARKVATVGTEIATFDKVVLQTMYGEVIKNLEISKMSMAQETPIIQIVDTPLLPLEKIKLGRLKGLIVGGIFGAILTISILVIRRAYDLLMK